MSYGKLYGIGTGPGDPELITVKGARIISECEHIFTPKTGIQTESLALEISQTYVNEKARIHELVFPMTSDRAARASRPRCRSRSLRRA